MRLWLNSTFLLVVIGCAKAQHFLHFVILGAFGLMGLWILSALVKDIDKLFNRPSAAAVTKPKYFFVKRSITDTNITFQKPDPVDLSVDWERILTNDPLGCARSFVCQLAARETRTLSKTDGVLLRLIKTAKQDSWATKQLNYAVDYGKKTREIHECRKYYSYCPYLINTMMAILNIFRGT